MPSDVCKCALFLCVHVILSIVFVTLEKRVI